ncbi:MAG TPA: hypothetical protein VMV10_27495 [Pirellulales bacterium]|nr:hypothetical protein [Pirellulales bacterium]
MNQSKHGRRSWASLLGGLGLLAAAGCQSDIGGQTLPSPYWQSDDVQYFPPGSEMKLSREAAAMKAYKNEQLSAGKQPVPAVQPGPQGPVPAPGAAPGPAPGPAPADVMP